MLIISIIAGYLAHLVIGDPDRAWHPARLLRRIIRFYESKFRMLSVSEHRAGIFYSASVTFDVFVTTLFALILARYFHVWLSFLLSAYLIYGLFSMRSLSQDILELRDHLSVKNDGAAREVVRHLCGIDADEMTEAEMIVLAIKAVSRETLCGIISPFFYSGLGGAPLAMVSKAGRVMRATAGIDAGGDPQADFARPACRLDDILNFIPARIAPWVISAGALFSGLQWTSGFRAGLRNAGCGESPDLGYAEASFAGALGICWAGMNDSNGNGFSEDTGRMARAPGIPDLENSVRLMYFSSFVALLFGLSVQLGIWGLGS